MRSRVLSYNESGFRTTFRRIAARHIGEMRSVPSDGSLVAIPGGIRVAL